MPTFCRRGGRVFAGGDMTPLFIPPLFIWAKAEMDSSAAARIAQAMRIGLGWLRRNLILPNFVSFSSCRPLRGLFHSLSSYPIFLPGA